MTAQNQGTDPTNPTDLLQEAVAISACIAVDVLNLSNGMKSLPTTSTASSEWWLQMETSLALLARQTEEHYQSLCYLAGFGISGTSPTSKQ